LNQIIFVILPTNCFPCSFFVPFQNFSWNIPKMDYFGSQSRKITACMGPLLHWWTNLYWPWKAALTCPLLVHYQTMELLEGCTVKAINFKSRVARNWNT